MTPTTSQLSHLQGISPLRIQFASNRPQDTSVTPASARVAAQKAAEQPELAALVVPERKPPPLDLKQLLKLQCGSSEWQSGGGLKLLFTEQKTV